MWFISRSLSLCQGNKTSMKMGSFLKLMWLNTEQLHTLSFLIQHLKDKQEDERNRAESQNCECATDNFTHRERYLNQEFLDYCVFVWDPKWSKVNLEKRSCRSCQTVANDKKREDGCLKRDIRRRGNCSGRHKAQPRIGHGGQGKETETGLLDVSAEEVGEPGDDEGWEGEHQAGGDGNQSKPLLREALPRNRDLCWMCWLNFCTHKCQWKSQFTLVRLVTIMAIQVPGTPWHTEAAMTSAQACGEEASCRRPEEWWKQEINKTTNAKGKED